MCGADGVAALAAIRSLGRAGVPVLVVDHRPSAIGFRSRYAHPMPSPDYEVDEAGFVESLVALAERFDDPLPLFVSDDKPLDAVGRNRKQLEERFLFPFPRWELLGRIQTKRFQLERAAELGIPVPRTRDAPSEDLTFPVLIKPSIPIPFRKKFGAKAIRCDTPAQLAEVFERARPYDPLIQEIIPGGDEELYTVGTYIGEDGAVLGVFSGRKLQQVPPEVGSCRVGVAIWMDEAVELALAFLRGLGFTGIAQVEFKRDPRDDRLKLMELNPRLWVWHGLAAACGVDLPRIAYLDLVGRRPAPTRMNGQGKRWAMTFAPDAPPALQRPPYVDAVWAWDDPKPALVHWARVMRS